MDVVERLTLYLQWPGLISGGRGRTVDFISTMVVTQSGGRGRTVDFISTMVMIQSDGRGRTVDFISTMQESMIFLVSRTI